MVMRFLAVCVSSVIKDQLIKLQQLYFTEFRVIKSISVYEKCMNFHQVPLHITDLKKKYPPLNYSIGCL